MDERFTPVPTLAALDGLFDRSRQAPVLLFQHDPSCPISAAAYWELMHLDADVAIVNVSRQRDVTRAIAKRTGVRHESPQVLVLRDGEAVWDASHFGITAAAIQRATVEPGANPTMP